MENIAIPRDLLKELREGLVRVEEVLVIPQELTNRDGLERIGKAEEGYEKGDYIAVKNVEGIMKKL